ncbi:hypothetical protein MTO96_022855, partial [Rhipicephalus appendiculatus]
LYANVTKTSKGVRSARTWLNGSRMMQTSPKASKTCHSSM